jgi:hypothetical protein
MKKLHPIVGGMIGAVLGFFVTLMVLELVGFGNPADPIMSGLLALLVFAPAGAVAGLVLGTKLTMRMRGRDGAGELAGNSLKSLAVVVVMVAASGAVYYFYAVATATPWLNPNAASPLLLFEVRLPAGAALPATAREIKTELQTDLNLMPGELRIDQFHRDGDRPVIVGAVELAFRTPARQLEVKIAGQPDRVYPIGLTDKAPHSSELGPWQRHTDGSEIRFRAKWPAQQ